MPVDTPHSSADFPEDDSPMGELVEFPDLAPGGGISVRQQRILDCINEAVAARGYPPSMREIAEKVGLASASAAQYQIRKLAEAGYITVAKNVARGIEVKSPAKSTEQRDPRRVRARFRHTRGVQKMAIKG